MTATDEVRPGTAGNAISHDLTTEQAQAIRQAHHMLDASYRGKSGVHTVTEGRQLIRGLLDVLGDITGIRSATTVLPFEEEI